MTNIDRSHLLIDICILSSFPSLLSYTSGFSLHSLHCSLVHRTSLSIGKTPPLCLVKYIHYHWLQKFSELHLEFKSCCNISVMCCISLKWIMKAINEQSRLNCAIKWSASVINYGMVQPPRYEWWLYSLLNKLNWKFLHI